jgi:YD repeat-containing protein
MLLWMAHPASRQQSGLQGAVRSVLTRVTQLARERGGLIEKPWYHSTVRYDTRGDPTEQVTHNPNGTVMRAAYVYDAQGRLSEMHTESGGAASGRTVYLYDGDGRLSYELSLRADGSEASQTRRFYEADGAYIEEFTGVGPAPLEGSGVTLSTERATFIRTRRDPAGRPLEMRFYDASGGLLYRFVYHYNAAGVLTDMEQRTGDQPLFELPAGTDLAGGVLRDFAALFSPDTALSTVRYRYDDQGRRIEAATWVGAHCIDRRAFEYNDRGEKSAERRYSSEGKIQSDTVYEREYDGIGNWILERVIEGGQPLSITRRTIEYEENDGS